MFRIKICGLTNAEDARAAAEAGADAIGLNFYEKSARCVSPDRARQIADTLPEGVQRIGVFVNATLADIRDRYAELSLDFVQLHGDEAPEFLAELRLPVIRAFRPFADLTAVSQYLTHCDRLKCRPVMVLLDAFRQGQFGGTGVTANWGAIRDGRSLLGRLPLVLAGGLRAENVGQAIAVVEPDAVDTASGVETAPGRPSAELVRAFVANAQRAFELRERSR